MYKTQKEELELISVYEKLHSMGVKIPLEHLEQTFKIQNLTTKDTSVNIEQNQRKTIKPLPLNNKSLPLDNIDHALQSDEFLNSLDKSENDIKAIVAKVINNSNSYEQALDLLYENYEDMDLLALEDELSLVIANATIKGKDNAY